MPLILKDGKEGLQVERMKRGGRRRSQGKMKKELGLGWERCGRLSSG